jgi:membrane protein YqaA with SNARE-associated domain
VARRSDRPWFLPFVSLFPASDYLLPFLPNQMLLAVLALLRPERWKRLALVFALATAAGAMITAFAVQAFGPSLLDSLFGGAPGPSAGAAAWLGAIERYGLAALIVAAMLPWPPRIVVLLCALAGLPPLQIGAAVAVGRLVPAFGIAWIAARSPRLVARLPGAGRLLRELRLSGRCGAEVDGNC